MISKVVLKNYKRFQYVEFSCNKNKNIFIGENGAGKTTVLSAISLVLSGSHAQIEKISLASLFNSEVISSFLTARNIDSLPEVFAEIYFDDAIPEIANNFNIEGTHNSKHIKSFGVGLRIIPNPDCLLNIAEALKNSDWMVFPFEFYKVEFLAFSGKTYTSYTKPFKFSYSTINTSLIDTNQEIQKRIDEVYLNKITQENRARVNHEFRKSTQKLFELLINSELIKDDGSDFSLHFEESESSFRTTVSAVKNGVDIKNLGQGEKVILGVRNSHSSLRENIKILLIEEPENHLSYLNMQKLVGILSSDTGVQVFIGTHSNMVASRLGIDNIILLSDGQVAKLQNIDSDTIRFFEKSTNQNLLNFALSNKVILVEGNAEYILMEKFFEMICEDRPENSDVSIISVDGLSFKRYLEIAKNFRNKKVAVVTDNDSDYDVKITEKYRLYEQFDNIQIFSDENNDNRTFEICLYRNNQELIDDLKIVNSSDIQAYMLREKAEFALRLLEKLEMNNTVEKLQIPKYMKEAIEWVRNC
ncbi:TPA: AAA family ATPase [Streptococcus equi subsp. zooepidemicus]|uniref:ATP-dependent nuclease n=1 Tax=Streptococcus equi TaxID=1336 RepID=UPI0005B7A206|nr:TOPRIM nucleotidyl transferase/hydrolase domain-containing protein [Streptococcus equi]KIS11559.1 putative ATP-dependentend nuclease of the OLD family protein [Streptococcus equi subsp. zooepidemicus Sz57]MCD3375752.1 AAA family ATPase [Streptococcus equi subsp. zooepidemicus]MCD3437967.1 AAA family ATPase [Streptococcus equi subsp. zooepidemicus]HEL0065887.1 AAA family ATPase [Streptococcus equi subsp. zooepidemicus]HEL0074068.1 AAA family ATPase [Streptococcus equi subsp. zooepidemicus]